ncbi:MAG: adenylate/guanylate cyclase domain-containing protein [Candidatus Gracilibacteria bacterium]|nr:adenylate/guanylate cyclase domain-containing protein [Candidatus Gracilibacteria bacterium]
MKLSIQSVNRTLMFLFFGSNILFIVFILKITSGKMIDIISIGNIFLNTVFIAIYLILNNRYRNDYNTLIENFRGTMIEEKSHDFKSNTHFFLENKEVETLFKKSYIKSNLLKKDFNDLHKVFKKFIPEDIYKEIGFRGYEKIVLGSSHTKCLSVMFLDIMGFTAISEQISPERTLLLLNIYFDGIGELIYKHGGYIDKFLGDGIMIIFEQETSDNALSCAIEIQDFIKRFQISSIGKKINIGIGINTGEVIVGTIGTKHRMDATVIGDTVNTASRLEGLTRKYGKNIILSQSVVDKMGNPERFSLHEIDTVILKGREQSTKIFSLDDFFVMDI